MTSLNLIRRSVIAAGFFLPLACAAQGPTPARLLAPGDTFDLRRVGAVEVGSTAARSLPCADRPPVAEVLAILDTAYYSIRRVVAKGCEGTAMDTIRFSSVYRLTADTMKFYYGDGNEVEEGPLALVRVDSIQGIRGSPETRATYVRRNRRR